VSGQCGDKEKAASSAEGSRNVFKESERLNES